MSRFYRQARPVTTKLQQYFYPARQAIVSYMDKAIQNENLDPNKIEAGHKIIALRQTILSRLYATLHNIFFNPLEEAEEEKVKRNQVYIRFTNHPTEGQNLDAIRNKDLVVKVASNLVDTLDKKTVTPENLVNLKRLAKQAAIDIKFQKTLPNISDFKMMSELVQQTIIADFIKKPIHHVKKMTVQDERDMLIYHLDRCRWIAASQMTHYPKLVTENSFRFSTWAGDMDGKPHIKPGHGIVFEYQSQQQFFKSLIEKLEDVADVMDLKGQDSTKFRRNVLEKIAVISQESQGKILVGDQAKSQEESINNILNSYPESQEEKLGKFFDDAKNFVRGSQCKSAPNGFTTREEVDKTNKVFAEITRICGNNDPKFFLRNADDKEITKKLAENFANLSDDSKRQIMCALEAISMHSCHEHIISQFDCEKSSYLNTLALFEVAKNLAQHHESIPYFREYYSAKSQEAGFDIYAQLFSPENLANIKKSVVEISPLAEEKSTILRIPQFTKELLEDDYVVAAIKRSGGILRQTRSNSDGSASLGPQGVVIRHAEADMAVKKMAAEKGLVYEDLQGIGANDIERMAPWNLKLLHPRFTAQGGDAQHVNEDRLNHLLINGDADKTPELLSKFKEKYSQSQLDDLLEFYYGQHITSEEGCDVKLEGKTIKSGHTTHRGPIPGTVVKYLGNLSSRPDSRAGDVAADGFEDNALDIWHKLIFNPTVRRIGAISLQRASGMSTFPMASFYHTPDVDPEMLYDFHQLPAIRNINISALFALGTADLESFLLANGLDFEIPEKTIPATAKAYEEFLRISREDSENAAQEFAVKNGLDSPEGLRAGHLCYQIEGAKNVLRNAITPLIHKSSAEVKEKLGKIFTRSESGYSIRKYNEEIIAACEILTHDQTIDLKTRQTLGCMAQQVANVHRPGNFYDTRADLTKNAHKALKDGNKEKFEKSCEWLAIIMRSAGNPVSPGRKTHELLEYFYHNLQTVFPMHHLIEEKNPKTKVASNSAEKLQAPLELSEINVKI